MLQLIKGVNNMKKAIIISTLLTIMSLAIVYETNRSVDRIKDKILK